MIWLYLKTIYGLIKWKKKNYKKIAKSVIDLEIKALKKLKNSINNSFGEAVESLANCQSKVILCGVGKSGLIAAKNFSNTFFCWNTFIFTICKRLFSW